MSLGTILSKIAPELEAALPLVGGPFGAVASMAIKAVSDVVSPGEPNPTVASITAALTGATPDQLLALTKINDDFKLKTQQMGIDVLKIQEEMDATDAADRASARTSFGIVKYVPQMVLSVVFIGGYFALVLFLIEQLFTGNIKLNDMNPAVLTIVTSLISVLTASVLQIMAFWFGSSHSSQKKDDALAAAVTA